MFIGNKKCRIYAACGVSQTPIVQKKREELKQNGGKQQDEGDAGE